MNKKDNSKITFTINNKTKQTFEEYINKNLLNKSKVIEKLIEEYLEKISIK